MHVRSWSNRRLQGLGRGVQADGGRLARFCATYASGFARTVAAFLVIGSTGCADDTSSGTDETASGSTGGGTAGTSATTVSPSTGVADTGSTGAESTGATDGGSTTATPSTDSSTGIPADTSSSGSAESSSTGTAKFVCDPVDLGSATGEVHTGTTAGGGDDLLVDCVKFDSVELEFQWTAPATASYQIDTFGSEFDTALMVLTDDCFGTQLGCNDDFSDLQSALLVDVTQGETIVIVVDGYGGASGNYALNIVESAPGDCCEAGFFGGCADNACEALVCAVDNSCCTDQWDVICAQEYAPALCADCAPPGSCCFPQPDGGCTDAECEADVCAIDPSCCDTQWTQSCADLAEQQCSACIPLDCCSPHNEAGCGTLSCQQIVCEEWDSWCCDQQWDEWCVQLANDNCAVCQEQGPCCVPNAGVGCEDPVVEQCVCDAMPECCVGQWTGECANAVTDLMCATCDPPNNGCVDFDLGSALGEVHTGTNVGAGDDVTISCTAAGGQEYVFSWVAPSTGTFIFDTAGSSYDTALSVRFPDCAGPELGCDGVLGATTSSVQLDLVQGQPMIITLDAFGAATGNYVLNINPPPGFGFCCAANGSPGCGSAACENAVCAVDPSCCGTDWDDSCAMQAIAVCAVCQNLGDCCIAHASPGCNDLVCAAQVCDFDPFCCDTQWADFCVEDTSFACAGVCM